MYLRVTVTPGSRKEALVKSKELVWHVSVKEKAEQNRANERVRTLIARECGVPLAHVRILTGHHSRSKMISVDTDITQL
jgi:uncharacterized protein YggU (UPF0235/DUF167 family)